MKENTVEDKEVIALPVIVSPRRASDPATGDIEGWREYMWASFVEGYFAHLGRIDGTVIRVTAEQVTFLRVSSLLNDEHGKDTLAALLRTLGHDGQTQVLGVATEAWYTRIDPKAQGATLLMNDPDERRRCAVEIVQLSVETPGACVARTAKIVRYNGEPPELARPYEDVRSDGKELTLRGQFAGLFPPTN